MRRFVSRQAAFVIVRLGLVGLVTLPVLATDGASARAQASVHRFFDETPPARGPYVRLEGDDERLQLRVYLGTATVGSLRMPHRNANGTIGSSSVPVMRRQYATLGGVGESIPLRPGVYSLTVLGTTVPSHLHEARAYQVSITSDVTALRLAYIDRRLLRRRRWLATSLVSAAGGVLSLASMIDGLESRGSGVNDPMLYTGLALIGSFQITFLIPLFTRDDARIDVVHADGRVVRARRRARD